MSANVDYLQSIIANQQSMQSSVTDAWALQTRYVFVPFRDRELTLLQMQNLGGMPELKAGRIIPITKYRMQDLDYREILDVPLDPDGHFQPVNEGVSKTILIERRPADVVYAILETFNRRHNTPDNGICEVEPLRGSDDMNLLLAVNRYCLPTLYKTCREQLGQLEKAVMGANQFDAVYGQVAERLLESTLQAQRWAEWHYDDLEASMEDRERSGKRRLSPLDLAVCGWLEKPSPKFRSNLVRDTGTNQVQQATPSRPTVQCEGCGNVSNLLVNNQPPKFCGVCREPFAVKDEAVEDASLEMTFSSNNPMAETEAEKKQRLADEQKRAKEALKAQKGNQ